MSTIDEVLVNLLGDYNLAFYISSFIFVGLGLLVSLRISAMSRNPLSPSTPYTFQWGFLIRDNALRIIGSFAFVFAIVRFGSDLTGQVPTHLGSFLLGLGFDKALEGVEKWSANRRKKELEKTE